MRFLAVLIAFAPLAACVVQTGPTDAGACPPGLDTTTACTVENSQCSQEPRCVLCGTGRYIVSAASCTCTGGFYYCSVPRCPFATASTFVDPECRVPFGTDAGTDTAATDAGGDDAVDVTGSDATDDLVDATTPSDACAPRPDAGSPSDGGCSSGRVACDGVCVDLSSDPRHCGACNNQCFAFQICSSGTCGCECAAGLTVCAAGCNACACRDLQTDSTHCGSCATACATGEVCVAGVCVRP